MSYSYTLSHFPSPYSFFTFLGSGPKGADDHCNHIIFPIGKMSTPNPLAGFSDCLVGPINPGLAPDSPCRPLFGSPHPCLAIPSPWLACAFLGWPIDSWLEPKIVHWPLRVRSPITITNTILRNLGTRALEPLTKKTLECLYLHHITSPSHPFSISIWLDLTLPSLSFLLYFCVI